MVFYEAPHKLTATLEDMMRVFGPERRISLCRELTKLHEEVLRTTLGEAAAYYQENSPRGEFVLVVEGAAPNRASQFTLETGLDRVCQLQEAGASLRDAVRAAAQEQGLSRSALYQMAVAQKENSAGNLSE